MSIAVKMVNRQILLLSSSQVHGHGFLEHSKSIICEFLQRQVNQSEIHSISVYNFSTDRNDVSEVTFVPYAHAQGDYDGYTKKISDVLTGWGICI